MSSSSAMAAISVRQITRAGGVWNLIGALILLAVFAPLMLSTALALAVLSGRSPLVAHRRSGQFGVSFWTLKFRSMWPGWELRPA